MKIKSLQVEVVEENGESRHVNMPIDVFAHHFSKEIMSSWGHWPEDYIKKLGAWAPDDPKELL